MSTPLTPEEVAAQLAALNRRQEASEKRADRHSADLILATRRLEQLGVSVEAIQVSVNAVSTELRGVDATVKAIQAEVERVRTDGVTRAANAERQAERQDKALDRMVSVVEKLALDRTDVHRVEVASDAETTKTEIDARKTLYLQIAAIVTAVGGLGGLVAAIAAAWSTIWSRE